MEIDKEQILEVLIARGEEDKAVEADERLPEQIDPDRDGEALKDLGLNTQGPLGTLGDAEGNPG